MNAIPLRSVNTAYLDQLFGWPANKPVPGKTLAQIPLNDLLVWCFRRAIYQIPSQELIDYLRYLIGDLSTALEIGAGAGQIGRALGIRMCDNHMQEWADIKAYYKRINQPTITYGADVEKLSAFQAIKRYQPETVLACWVTEKFIPGKSSGNMYGVDESWLLEQSFVKTYILVGNRQVHSDKQVLKTHRFEELAFPWLFSRQARQEDNRIWIYKRP